MNGFQRNSLHYIGNLPTKPQKYQNLISTFQKFIFCLNHFKTTYEFWWSNDPKTTTYVMINNLDYRTYTSFLFYIKISLNKCQPDLPSNSLYTSAILVIGYYLIKFLSDFNCVIPFSTGVSYISGESHLGMWISSVSKTLSFSSIVCSLISYCCKSIVWVILLPWGQGCGHLRWCSKARDRTRSSRHDGRQSLIKLRIWWFFCLEARLVSSSVLMTSTWGDYMPVYRR